MSFKMFKNSCCSICLSVNKRTTNIYKTDLQYVYENLVNLKIRDNECWTCYICHTRLRQCQQLQQLAVQTRGLIYDIFQNKINIKLGAFESLLELSTSRTKIFSTTLPYLKQESDRETEVYYDNRDQHDLLNNTIIEIVPSTCSVKRECEVKTECCSDDDVVQHDIFENTNEENPLTESEDASDDVVSKRTTNVGDNGIQTAHTSDLDQAAPGVEHRTPSAVIKHEVEVEIGGRGVDQDERDSTSECAARDLEAQPGRRTEPFSCEYCSKRFRFRSKLLNHARVHTGEKPFACDICTRSFSHKCHLIVHIRTHTDDRPFGCDACPKRFSQRRYLLEHASRHTGDKAFRCHVCSKTFTRKFNLSTHMRTHTQATPHVCGVCSRRFTQSNHLEVHMRAHTGVKPFSCGVCSKRFSRTSSLNVHKLVHTRDKLFSCGVCSKRFLRKGHLTDHLITHRGDQPHGCRVCLKKFSRKSTLQRHMKNHCGEES